MIKVVTTIKRLKHSLTDFFARDWTLSEKILITVCCMLFGIIQGFLLSPIKKGISIGNNNGNTNGNCYSGVDDSFLFDDEGK